MEVRNRFKGLDLLDRVADELWMEVHDTVQETGHADSDSEGGARRSIFLNLPGGSAAAGPGARDVGAVTRQGVLGGTYSSSSVREAALSGAHPCVILPS